jgi:5-methylcytosine-specific restriction endonuclease McrA
MKTIKLQTIRELLYWSYANLAMSHSAVESGCDKFNRTHFIIRSRLFSGLMNQSMSIGSLIDDEKIKMKSSRQCCYCGKECELTIDHLIPQARGGAESGDNAVWSCQSCNSSKGKKDFLDWMEDQGKFPSLFLLRRYLKIVINFCDENGLMEEDSSKVDKIPFSINKIPIEYPTPKNMTMY